MKKLLLLGGSSQQVIAITTAKQLGYYTILCDYLPDNPGKEEADVFYQISTTDKEAVLNIALKEKIDGIIAYSSDPAAPTAAYVAEKMALPGIPYKIAESFCNKNLFRCYLKEHGFNVPLCVEFTNKDDFSVISKLQLPIVIKPTDSSGSKGVTVLKDLADFEKAQNDALKVSRNNILIAEEYIERDHPDVIEAELFIVDGQIAVWGLMNTVRDPYTNPLLPAAYSYPLNLSAERIKLVKKEVSKLISSTGVIYGAFNLEMVITKEEKLYFLDAGPRNGGNELPEYIGMIAKRDLVEATILAAMGDYKSLDGIALDGYSGGYWGMCVLHADHEGRLERIEYDNTAKNALVRESLFKQHGDQIKPFNISRDAVGLAYFEFPNQTIRDGIVNDFKGEHIRVITG